MHGGAADRSGLIAVGDEVIEVRGGHKEITKRPIGKKGHKKITKRPIGKRGH